MCLRFRDSAYDQWNVFAPGPILSKYSYMAPLISPPSPQVIKNDFACCCKVCLPQTSNDLIAQISSWCRGILCTSETKRPHPAKVNDLLADSCTRVALNERCSIIKFLPYVSVTLFLLQIFMRSNRNIFKVKVFSVA